MRDDTETDFCDRLPGQHTGRLSLELQASEAAEWQEIVDMLATRVRNLENDVSALKAPPATPSAAVGVDGPWAGDTVPPEVGKRYVCRNGEVTDAMTDDGGPAYPFMARVNGVHRSWKGDGRHDESKVSDFDLIAEYHEPAQPAESPDVSGEIRGLKYALEWIAAKRAGNPNLKAAAWEMLNETQVAYEAAVARLQDGEAINSTSQTNVPAESPDDWVTLTDPPQHVIRTIDECRRTFGPDRKWEPCVGLVGSRLKDHVHCYEFRCRRKDLPPVPVVPQPLPSPWNPMIGTPSVETALQQFVEWHDMDHENMTGSEVQSAYDKVIADAKAALQSGANKPKTRTVTLREYRHTNDEFAWTSASTYLPMITGRTCKSEVPE